MLACDAPGEVLDDALRGFHADIGHQQAGFQIFQQFVIDLLAACDQAGNTLGQSAAGLGQAGLEAPEQTLFFILARRILLRRPGIPGFLFTET